MPSVVVVIKPAGNGAAAFVVALSFASTALPVEPSNTLATAKSKSVLGFKSLFTLVIVPQYKVRL
jgi:hypothetical protein